MKAKKLFRIFFFSIIGFMLCACRSAVVTEHIPAFSTPSRSLPQQTPSVIIPTAATLPIPSHTLGERPTLAAQTPVDVLRITIVYENHAYDPRLQTAWGFSALVEYRSQVVLFDTGGDSQILLENMQVLGIDLGRIQSIVLSHGHADHTGGLSAILDGGVRPPVYLLPSFPDTFKQQVEQLTQAIEVTPGQVIGNGILTTGEIAGNIPEQSLLIRTGEGLVVITGCSHPGVVEIVESAVELTGDPVYLVLGGFHLGSTSESEISAILADLRQLGVQKAAPCHCSGERAIAMFALEYGEGFIQVGVGTVISINK